VAVFVIINALPLNALVSSACPAHLSVFVSVGRELDERNNPTGRAVNTQERNVSTLMSGRAPTRSGGPQNPAPRVT
jgi:hypothetical protein